MHKINENVHKTHCCLKHGCKYGDNDCPVEKGLIKQDFPCEICDNNIKKDEDEEFIRGYHRTSKAWYASSLHRNTNEVIFGLYIPDDGCIGEIYIQWEKLNDIFTPKLNCFDDSWKVLASFTDVIQRMGEVDSKDIQEPEFCKILDECGFKDMTQYHMENEYTKNMFLDIIKKIPHSKDRVPYTYHHDYLRKHSKFHYNMSRSDIADSHTSTENELYAITLTELLTTNPEFIYNIEPNDLIICKKAKEITDSTISRYN